MIGTAFPTDGHDVFVAELKGRIRAHFERRGIGTYANGAMVLKTTTGLSVSLSAYALILSGWLPAWTLPGMVVLMAVAVAGVVCCASHDALHGTYSSSPRVNHLLGLTSVLLGVHGYQWKRTHNRGHHVYTNVHQLDGDVTLDPVLRLTPDAEWRWFHRYQHIYAWPLYSTTTLFWAFAKDYINIVARPLSPSEDVRHPWAIAGLVGGKLFHYGFTIVVPWIVLDLVWWQLLIGLLLFHLTAGLILGTVFMLAHSFEEAAHPGAARDGAFADVWHVHQLKTTTDFARGNRWLDWYLGGLNYQVEHHLFPGICSIHYAAISPIVEATAREYGLPFHAASTLEEALATHHRTLIHLGQRPTVPRLETSASASTA